MLLDIAIGICGSVLFAFFTEAELTPVLVLFGIVFALLPDIDFLIYLAIHRSAGRFAHEHRDIFHYPLLFVPGLFLILYPLGFSFAAFGALLSLFHFLHDSVGIGWGVKWLFPFNLQLYKLRDNGRWFVSRTPDEVRIAAATQGNDNWVKDYFRSFRRKNRT